MNKELALIFEYQTAPESLKKVAKEYKEVEAKLSKKSEAFRALSAEVEGLKDKALELSAAFRAELNAWTPKGE